MLLAGADKVSINSAAVTEPGLVTECSNKFGSQCIVVAIDAKREWEEKVGKYLPMEERSQQVLMLLNGLKK